MGRSIYSLASLFDQLGLDSSEKGIEVFISSHAPLPSEMELHEAGFWNSSQVAFIKQAINDDAEWTDLVDHLDIMLR